MLLPMTAPKDHSYDTDLLETLSQRVMVGDGAMGTQLQDADLSLDDFYNRRRRGRDEIRSAAIWLTLLIAILPTRSTSWRSGRRDRQAGRVELGVQTSADDVNFSGREALQRVRVPTDIRHARQIQGRLPLRKERT
jgi:hypothetical protein